MDEITANIEKEFGIELGPVIDKYFDRDMPDQSIYFFEKYALIVTDYFSDDEVELFFPKVIKKQFGKQFIKYLKSTDGEICFLSDEGWVFVAEVA